jgi:AcrR family transcriptional regulator/transcriptional regulator with XRE-family HTH domain
MDPSASAEAVRRSLGEAVRRHRLTRGLSLRELARRISVSAATMSAVENGKTPVSVDRLQRIGAVLQVPVASLVGGLGPGGGTEQLNAADGSQHWRHFPSLVFDEVLAGAIKVFVVAGYHGASMRSIAQQANMSVPGVYHHYPSKQHLLSKALEITMADLIWRLESARNESGVAWQRLALVVEALALFHARRHELAFIGASEMRSLEPANYGRIAARRDHVQHILDQVVVAAAPKREFPDSQTGDAGKAIATMCTGLASWFRPDGPTSPEEIAQRYAQFSLRLVGLPVSSDTSTARLPGTAT